MPFATVEEAQVRVEELEKENRNLTREVVSKKAAFQDVEQKYNKLTDTIKAAGIEDLEGDIKSQIESVSGKTDMEKALKSIEKRLKQTEETNSQLLQEKELTTKELTAKRLTEALSKHTGDIIGAQDTVERMILKGLAKETKDGKVVCLDDEGDEVAVDKFFEKFRKNNPDRVKVTQSSGSGSSGGNKGTQTNPGTTAQIITQGEYLKLSGDAKKAFYEAGGSVKG